MARPRKSIRELLTQVRKDVLGDWFELPGFLRDRRRVLGDLRVVLCKPRTLKNGPLAFASRTILLPALLLAVLANAAAFLIHAPEVPEERQIEELTREEQSFEDNRIFLGLWPSTRVSSQFDAMSSAELERRGDANRARLNEIKAHGAASAADRAEIERIRRESYEIVDSLLRRTAGIIRSDIPFILHLTREQQASVKAIAKVNDAKREWLAAVTSVSLMVNSLLFGYLARRRFGSERWVGEGHVVHLYAVAAAMAPILFLATLLAIASDFLRRYEIAWMPIATSLLLMLLSIWAIRTLWSVGARMASLNTSHSVASARALSWRVLLSNLTTNIVMTVLLTAAYRQVIHLVYVHEITGSAHVQVEGAAMRVV